MPEEQAVDPYSFSDSPKSVSPSEETSRESAVDPYSLSDSSSDILNISGQDGGKLAKEFPLRDSEKILAEWSPTLYATIHTATDLFPYASLIMWPSERDKFMSLEKEDQIQALLIEALALALWGAAGPISKGIGYVYRGMVKKPIKSAFAKVGRAVGVAAKEAKVFPYEDAVKGVERILGADKAEPFSYVDVAAKRLKGKGFGEDEAKAVASVLAGADEGRLLDLVLERRFKGQEPTKAFEKVVSWKKGRLYPMPELRKAVRTEFGEELLRAKYYNRQFEGLLSREVLKADPSKRTTKYIFDAHAKRLFGEGAPKEYGDVTPHQMSNIILDMLENKIVSKEIINPVLMATLTPARIVFGYGEKFLGTLTNIQIPMKASLGEMNKSYFNNSLLFAKMLEQRGAGKVLIKESGEFRFKKAKWLTPASQNEAHSIMMKADELSTKLVRVEGKAERDQLTQELTDLAKDVSPGAKVLVETTRAYFDHLYSTHVKLQIPRVFRKAGLTELGQNQVDNIMAGANGIEYEIDRLFSSVSRKTPTEKIVGMKEVLKKVRGRLEAAEPTSHPYFKAEGEELKKTLEGLRDQLTWGKGNKGFTKYLDNYVARVSQHEDSLLQRWKGGLFKEQSAAYTKRRKLEKQRGEPTTFGQMIQARTLAHAKEHYLYDTMGKVIKYAEGLPPAWIEYTDGYLGGILSVPTASDYKLAQFFQKSIDSVKRMFGKEGEWSAQRVSNLAYTVNNLAYLGGLGFKPFSAVRNLFQPLLTVPADLGGVKDLGRLTQGYKWALNPQNRAYIRSLGAITEYAPEIHMRPTVLRQGKMFFGKELPSIEALRDTGMWMFKGSDRFNRYVTGGAAVSKWDGTVAKIGEPKTAASVNYFSKKMKLSGRRPWKQAEIEDLLHRGKFAEAKAAFVSDVIADTQYLYGAADAPTALRKYGAIGKTGFTFQSWWMNYGALLQKWATTGQIEAKAERVLVGFISQSMAYMLMEPLWGKTTAVRSTFLGPFPKEFNEFLLPPSWTPVYHAVTALATLQTPEVSSRHAKAVLDSSAILIPGGLQLKSFYRGAKDEGFEGFSRAILRLKKPE